MRPLPGTMPQETAPGTRVREGDNVPERLKAQPQVLDGFLEPEVAEGLLTYACREEPSYADSSTSNPLEDYRASRVIETPEFGQVFAQMILEKLLPQLDVPDCPAFNVGSVEVQLTAHNDGAFYRTHTDSCTAPTATRVLTYVYYLNHVPKTFQGGELVVYDSFERDDILHQAESHQLVEPQHNRLVVFPSHYFHEVLPIRCPSRRFADSRFTINGWLRHKAGDRVERPRVSIERLTSLGRN